MSGSPKGASVELAPFLFIRTPSLQVTIKGESGRPPSPMSFPRAKYLREIAVQTLLERSEELFSSKTAEAPPDTAAEA